MHPHLQALSEASKGLLFISESDYPLEPVQLDTKDIEAELKMIAGVPVTAVVDTVKADYFFRNMVKWYPGDPEERKQSAELFQHLLQLLQEKLKGPAVYRIGTVHIHAFIIGLLPDGSYGGLRTQLIET